jgi:VWFA-related protein
MQLTALEKRRLGIRVPGLIGAGVLAMALGGCVTQTMAPVEVPISSHEGRLNLCNQGPTRPPSNLASNPNYLEFSVDVIDSNGTSASGLTQSDFVVTENDRPISVAYFRVEEGRPPVSIGILVDKSGSMVTKLPVISASVDALLPKLNACDEVMLYAFGMDPILVQDFTTDHARVGQRLRYVQAFGQTPFYDGVHQGIARLDNSHYPDRVAIIFTDDVSGILASSSLDNASKSVTRDDLVSSALNSQSRFFVVGVGKPDASQHSVAVSIGSFTIGGSADGVGVEDLKKFATDSGAGFFLITAAPDKNAPKVATSTGQNYVRLAADPAEIQQFATQLSSQIDRHYTIGMISSGQPSSGANHITIKLANRPSARVTFHQVVLSPSKP